MVLTEEDLLLFKPKERKIELKNKEQWEFMNRILEKGFWNGFSLLASIIRTADSKLKTVYFITDAHPNTANTYIPINRLFKISRSKKNKLYIEADSDHPMSSWRYSTIKISPEQRIILVAMFPELVGD